ncbi:hypothetical protein BpHYR1_015681 [Brachionus plicatilis]|uniref:Uncharacterized protein n=1 Tax=Brachionus plicatilis TaxID=10195 RepID=A0A3M7PJ94_BRAPC|nr:hypothetical protein BpHYR1_015681 [Brachionus plicatilis]
MKGNNKQNFIIVQLDVNFFYILIFLFGSNMTRLGQKKGWPAVEISQLMKKESRNRYLLSTKLYN